MSLPHWHCLHALNLLRTDGQICVAIDDFEYPQHFQVMSGTLGLLHSGTAVIRSKPQERPTASGFSANHEYAVFWSAVEKPSIGRLPRKGSKAERYPYADENGIYSWANFRKSGTDSNREDRKKSFYPVYVQGDKVRAPAMTWSDVTELWTVTEEPTDGESVVWPVDADGNEKVWTCSVPRLRKELDDVRVIRGDGDSIEIQKKYRIRMVPCLVHGGTAQSILRVKAEPRFLRASSRRKILISPRVSTL